MKKPHPEKNMNDSINIAHLSEKGAQLFPKGAQSIEKGLNLRNSNGLSANDVWLTILEGAQLLDVSDRTIQYRCQRGYYSTKIVIANGGKQYRIQLSSLPIDAQMKYWESEIMSHEPVEQNDLVPAASFAPGILPEKEDKIALAWADLLKIYTSITDNKPNKVAVKKRFVLSYNSGAFPVLLETLGTISYQTIERQKKKWLEAMKNPQVLAPKYNFRGRSRSINSKTAYALLSKALSPNCLRINEAIREARGMMHAQGIACEVSNMTLRRWLDDWKAENYDIWQLCRHGEKRLNDVVLPYIQRDYSKIEVGDIAVADGHTLNFDIINPYTGKSKRMTLIVLSDMKSSYPLGWEIMPAENIQAISSTFRRGILTLGFSPLVFYLDNGKAFRAKYFSQTQDFRQSGLSGLFERLGSHVIYAWAYHGQSKTIERMFGSLGEMERLTPSYTGSSIENKPPRLLRNEKWHQKMWERISGGATPTIEEAHWIVAEWFAKYVHREQQDGHLKGQRPIDVFQAGLARIREREDFSLRIKTPEELTYLMMSEQITKLYRNGIRFMGTYFYHEALFPYSKENNANQFLIKYDIGDMKSILVFSESGEYICKAYRTDTIHPAAAYLGTAEDVKKLQKEIELKRSLAKETRKTAEAFFTMVSNDLQASPIPEIKALPKAEENKELPEEAAEIIDIVSINWNEPEREPERINIRQGLLKPGVPPEDEYVNIGLTKPSKKERKIYLFETDKDIAESKEPIRKASGE